MSDSAIEAGDLRREAMQSGIFEAAELLEQADGLEPEPWAPSLTDYHADNAAVGSTMLGDFRSSPGLFHGRYVSGSIPPTEVGRAAHLGTLLHLLVDGQELHIAPKAKTRAHGNFIACQEEFGDAACVQGEFDQVSGAFEALSCAITPMAQLAKWLLLDCSGQREYSHRWEHPSGVTCKVRFDVLPHIGHAIPGVEHLFADLKFVNDPSMDSFAAISAKFGRHHQAALYSLGYLNLRGSWPVVCYVVIGNTPPHQIKVCTLSEGFIEIGIDQIQGDLYRLAECRRTGEWFDSEELDEEIPDIQPPGWLWHQYERKIND